MGVRVSSLGLLLGACTAAAAVAACGPAVGHTVGHTVLPPRTVVSVPAPAPRLAVQTLDAALRTEWSREGLEPSAPVDDARYLRRVSLDLIGRIPTLAEVRAFAADHGADKRERLVEQLLASPDFAEYWASYWEDVLLGRGGRAQQVDRPAFRGWLRGKIAANVPWDRVARELVSASGANRGAEAEPSAMPAPVLAMGAANEARGSGEGRDDDGPPVNGAVNWLVRHADSPADLAGLTSRAFLGVQIQCAQCHDHKTEAWTQESFRELASSFARLSVKPLEAKMPGAPRRVVVRDEPKPLPRYAKDPDLGPVARATPTALDGTVLRGPSPREALAAWITGRENPYFAKAFVNRMWGHFLGRGFVNPVDDLRPSNAAVAAPVLDALAKDFALGGYDVQRLFRLITSSEAYARSSSPAVRLDPSNAYWARFRLSPLGPEELIASVFTAAGFDGHGGRRAAAWDALRAQLDRQYGFLFDVDEEQDQRDYEGSVAQALALINGALVEKGSSLTSGGALGALVASAASDAEKVETLYLRVLGRKPTDSEARLWLEAIEAARGAPAKADRRPSKVSPAVAAAYEDLTWALFNSSEFLFNH